MSAGKWLTHYMQHSLGAEGEAIREAMRIVREHPEDFGSFDFTNVQSDAERDAEFLAWEEANIPEAIATIEFYLPDPEQ